MVEHLLQDLVHEGELLVLQLGVDHLRDEEREDASGEHVHRQAVALVRHHHLVDLWKGGSRKTLYYCAFP